MIKTAVIVITSLIAVLLIYLFPGQAVNPGDLSKGHQHLENECMKCHTLFLGTPGEKCTLCHRPADIGRITTAGVVMEAIPGQQKTAFHHLLSADSCLSCHRDHKGRDQGKAAREFSHALLQGAAIKECSACHKGPADTLHGHREQECSRCHRTEGWRPAALDHAQYFRFDRQHGPDCLACHRDSTYGEYTCYGCHEHSPGRIEEEHREEGIRNYQDCAACHPSADERDTRRVFRSGRFHDRSWKGFEREEYIRQESYEKARYNDHDDDDDDRHEEDDDHDRDGSHDRD